MKIEVTKPNKSAKEEVTLSNAVFGVKPNANLIHQVITSLQSSKRAAIASTKTKGEVRGGGKKPWRQKGTGRARAGSARSPLWRGGGVTFGPRANRNFEKKIPKKVKLAALSQTLSAKIAAKKIIIISDIKFDKISTKAGENFLNPLPFEGTALLVLSKKDEKVEKSLKNLPYISVKTAQNFGVFDVLRYDYLVLEKSALTVIEERITGAKKSAEKVVKEKQTPVKEGK